MSRRTPPRSSGTHSSGKVGVRTANHQPDIGAIGESLKRPGMDTRRWAFLAMVDKRSDAVHKQKNGFWFDCAILETGEPVVVWWGLQMLPGGRGGLWYPAPEPGEVIICVADGGDPQHGTVGLAILPSGDAKYNIPSDVLASPKVLYLHNKGTVTVRTQDGVIVLRKGDGAAQAVARENDKTKVDGITDAALFAWITAVHNYIVGAGGALPAKPTTVTGKIDEGSDDVFST